jgi:hypothetical protein
MSVSIVKRIGLALFLAILLLLPSPVYAQQEHENPADAQLIFNGLSLLIYYSYSLDPIIQRDEAGTQTDLNKMPFTNIPDALSQPTASFAASGISLSETIVEVYTVWQEQNDLVKQYRLKEAKAAYERLTALLPEAYDRLTELKTAVTDTGVYLRIDTLSPSNQMLVVYQEILTKLDRLEAMLDLYEKAPADYDQILIDPDILETLPPEELEKLQKPTELILEINPDTAFVGDSVEFSGSLTSLSRPLSGRHIDILLDGIVLLSVDSDASGSFQGSFAVPYRYISQSEVQAVFFPQDADIGSYLGASSEIQILHILFYSADLQITLENGAYPGLSADFECVLDYGQAPPVERKEAAVSLDGNLYHYSDAPVYFTVQLPLAADIELGKHTLNINVPADKRYAPVNGICVFEVTQVPLVLDIDLPALILMPGGFDLSGSLDSALGSPQNAEILAVLNKHQIAQQTDDSGYFTGRVQTGLNWNFFGRSQLTIQVNPQEPWFAPLTVTRNLFIFNYLVCGLILLVIAGLAIILPLRLRKALHLRLKQKTAAEPIGNAVIIQAATVNPSVRAAASKTVINANANASQAMLGWYRNAVKLVQRLSSIIFKPELTLREYAAQIRNKFGPLGKYLYDFTLIIEKLLYSRHTPEQAELENGRELSEKIERESGHENL